VKIFLRLLLILPCLSNAQVKILFDASKAESANNADWIIDADQNNMTWNPGPILNYDESNAQRTPTPTQSGVTASTAETYWKGAISAWGIDCAKQGYICESLPYNGSITFGNTSNPQDLSNYNVFIVPEPNILFTTAEKTAIINFVQNGGGLFMVSDHDQSDRNGDGNDSPTIWNDLMTNNSIQSNPFGISFDLQNFSGTYSNVANSPSDSLLHGPFGSVTQMKWSGGTSMTLNTSKNATVKGVLYKTSPASGNTNVLVSYARFGKGKVAAIGDSSPMDDGTGDTNDVLYKSYTQEASGNHQKLLMNATIWLANTAVTQPTGVIENMEEESSFFIYPNPATNELVLSTNAKNGSVLITDMEGEILLESKTNEKLLIQTTDWATGTYFAKLIEEKVTRVQRFNVVH